MKKNESINDKNLSKAAIKKLEEARKRMKKRIYYTEEEVKKKLKL